MVAAAQRQGKPTPRLAPSFDAATLRSPRLVVVGGSAGGMEALKAMLRPLPATFPAAILVVLHLDPDRPSQATSVLEGHTRLTVEQATDGERPRPGTVYLAPPDRHLELRGGRMALTRSARVNFSRPSVDRLLGSAAKDHGDRTLAVILSGTGFDGRDGIKRIHACGGTCIVEDPATSSHAGMPQASLATGFVDVVLPADRIGSYLLHAANRPRVRVTAAAWTSAERLLKHRCNADFQGYRPETLRRRMAARITAVGLGSAEKYVALLRKDDGELEKLRSALLVKVSAFMRDPGLWRLMERHCLARLASAEPQREVRMWSAGCATGEEAYTLAMLTLALGRGRQDLKVFGTDLDEPALTKARSGRYARAAVANLPRGLVRRYFTSEGDSKRINADVRRHVIFGRHDLLRDPPLSGMDLVACRNVLIYLKPLERTEVLRRLASALRPGGILFLGKAEGASLPSADFERVTPGAPVFRRKARAPREEALAVPTPARKRRAPVTIQPGREPVMFAVDRALAVTMWSRAAEVFFGMRSEHALGRPLFDLVSRPRQLTDAAMKAAMGRRKRSKLPDLSVAGDGVRRRLAVEAAPLPRRAGLMFIGVPRAATGRTASRSREGRGAEPRGSDRSHGSQLQQHMDAQQTLNEELQSRNEELETVNEELQSLNDEIQVQGDEARRATLFLGALLDAGPDVVIGCDRQGKVSYWGAPAVQRFGLSSAQALGKDLLRLVPQLDVPSLRKLVGKSDSWPKKGRSARRVVKVSASLQVAVFPALDADGKAHGTLLRVLQK